MTLAGLLGTAALAQAQPGLPDYTKSVEKLQQATQHLRETVQSVAQKPAGPDRDRATEQAHQALLNTQRALAAVPDPGSKGPAIAPSYDESMAKLKKASERLHESVQALTKQEPGPRRNQAMDQARQAMWEAQQAMVGLPTEVTWSAQGAATGASVGSSTPPAAGGTDLRPRTR
jgi:hypothetical protein